MVSKYNTLVDDYNSLVKQYNEATNSTELCYKHDDYIKVSDIAYTFLLIKYKNLLDKYKNLLDKYYMYKDSTSTVKHIVTKDMIGWLLVVSVVINIVFGLILLGWI